MVSLLPTELIETVMEEVCYYKYKEKIYPSELFINLSASEDLKEIFVKLIG